MTIENSDKEMYRAITNFPVLPNLLYKIIILILNVFLPGFFIQGQAQCSSASYEKIVLRFIFWLDFVKLLLTKHFI